MDRFGELHSMSHFAKVLRQPFTLIVNGQTVTVNGGIVTNVIVAEQEFFETFVDTTPGDWIQTSYNTRGGVHYAPSPPNPPGTPDGGVALRGNYATIGGYYDFDNDVFYGPQPYPSWTISAPTWVWTPLTPYPTDGNRYYWDEPTTAWVLYSDE
jgi:hypothetical protein